MNKRILILFFVVVFLGTIIVLFENPSTLKYQSKDGSSFYPQLKKENIQVIEINYFIQGTRLEKNSQGQWYVSEFQNDFVKQMKTKIPPTEKFLADPNFVDQAIAVFLDLKKGEPVSVNPEKQGLFQLQDRGLNVALRDEKGNKLAKLYIGKQGPDPFSTFVRDEGSNEVYLINQYLFSIFNRTLDDWKKQNSKENEIEN